jgi:nucleoid-associated protein YgaU
MVPSRLPAGSYELTLSARLPDGTVTSSKQGVAVTVDIAEASAPATQSHAEYVPGTAPQTPASEPPLQAGRPRETAANNAGSAPDEAASPLAGEHAVSSKVVSRGDSLWRISRIKYGDGSRYALVYRANRDRIRDPNLIYPGQTIVLPVKPN